MQLAHATWPEVEAYLAKDTTRGIIIPIGATEQHGPNGLIGTDHLCAEFVAKGVGEVCNAYVAPTLTYGMSQHHLGFTGSVTLRPSTMAAMVRDIVQSLNVHGFEKFFFLNGHGGNVTPLKAAFDEIYADASLGANPAAFKTRCMTMMWQAGGRTRALAQELYHGNSGMHATAAEISLVQFYRPDDIKHVEMSPKVAPPHTDFFHSLDYRMRYPDGRIGSDPSMSCPEHGERLLKATVTDLSEAYQAFLAY
ncbi:creatininase family protein [Bosea caraganae]|uniref:Creatininase family protein n=1 Tax=Bosea caraganae TaxID=2763117 RepID=A0A370LCX0_9HYPH|nr:creatininase family protein [Bosea caraganae]RDJ27735.1 creatininase family protein [Bosea caraganae]RDJ29748.1 creatininase family protein [Bosea caraganae]